MEQCGHSDIIVVFYLSLLTSGESETFQRFQCFFEQNSYSFSPLYCPHQKADKGILLDHRKKFWRRLRSSRLLTLSSFLRAKCEIFDPYVAEKEFRTNWTHFSLMHVDFLYPLKELFAFTCRLYAATKKMFSYIPRQLYRKYYPSQKWFLQKIEGGFKT